MTAGTDPIDLDQVVVPPQDEWTNLVPLDGDPETVRLPLPGEVREVQALLASNSLSPSYGRAIETVRTLERRDAARGREMERMRSLVLGVTSGEARQGLEDEIRLLTERLARRDAEIVEQGEQFTEAAQQFQERYDKLDKRRQRAASRADQAYRAWMSASVRLEHQAETIRTLLAKVQEWSDIADQATQALAELKRADEQTDRPV